MNKPIRVLVIDDSAFNRRTLTRLLESIQGVEVVATATDGNEGLKQAMRLKPDLITLDLEMPVMDGFTFLRILMRTSPTPVIVISSRGEDINVFKAMELGAVDFIPKPTHLPSLALFDIKDELAMKIKMLPHLQIDKVAKFEGKHQVSGIQYPEERQEEPRAGYGAWDVVAVGSSTGGPPALSAILPNFPEGFPASVVVSQHMPPGFTKPFAERLNKICKINVREAGDNEEVKGGEVLIAPGGCHLSFRRDSKGVVMTRLQERRGDDKYVPSVDIMFSSSAEVWGRRTIGVVLTGMGHDGKNGVVAIKEKGGYVMAESQETSIIFGMPESAIATGKVDEVVPLYDIGPRIVRRCAGDMLKRA